MTAVQKVKLTRKDGKGSLELPYNPEDLRMSASARYEPLGNNKEEAGPVQFMGRSARSLSLLTRLDSRGRTKPVKATVEMLFGWTMPTNESVRANAPEPPVLRLTWGRQSWFDVRLNGVEVTYSLFDPDGTPLRAECTLGLDEVVTRTKRQNPTSGGPAGRRVHVLVAGDSLQSVATAEYGAPARWRDLALVNGVDDPLALRPGDRLLLPALAELPPLGRPR